MSEKNDALRERLAAAKSAIESGTGALEETDEERLTREVVEAEREAALVAAMVKGAAEHGAGKIAPVRTSAGHILVRCPAALRWRKFVDREDYSSKSLEELVKPCVLFPDIRELTRIFEEVPASLARTASALTELAQGQAVDLAKK